MPADADFILVVNKFMQGSTAPSTCGREHRIAGVIPVRKDGRTSALGLRDTFDNGAFIVKTPTLRMYLHCPYKT